MATDAIVVENQGRVELNESLTTLAELAPMQPGRSYLIWANCSVGLLHATVILVLEAFDAKAETGIVYHQHDVLAVPSSLTIATTLPADDDLFTVAKLSASVRPLSPEDPSGGFILDPKLVVLPVDSVSVTHS